MKTIYSKAKAIHIYHIHKYFHKYNIAVVQACHFLKN